MSSRFLIISLMVAVAGQLAATEPEFPADFQTVVQPFLRKYCAECHGESEPAAELRLDQLPSLEHQPGLAEQWERVFEMLSIGDMPPEEATQPAFPVRQQVMRTIEAQLKRLGRDRSAAQRALPKFGNRMDHDALFGEEDYGPAYTPARVWRMNAHIYSQLVADLQLGNDFVPPLPTNQGEGFRDYATLFADEAAIRTMLQNGKRVAMSMVHGRLVKPRGAAEKNPHNKPHRKPSKHRLLQDFARLEAPPTSAQLDEVIRYTFEVLLHREPSERELQRYREELLEPGVGLAGVDEGVRQFLVAMLLAPEFLFRMELGLGASLPDGRRMLGPGELAFAISYAFYDHPLPNLVEAARAGRLETRSDVEREVRAILASQKLLRGQVPAARRQGAPWQVGKLTTTNAAKPRLLRFFREYFGYPKAADVFKDDIRHGGVHVPRSIIADADWFVLSVLAKDRQVLRELLTSDAYYVAYKRTKYTRYMDVYNLTDESRSSDGPSNLPEGQRAGMLTHPAWLVAHSGNFETDPVRRGKWIQEHLLGGVVPDLPIGVEAQLPAEPKHTLRERFRVVRAAECWRCHKKMNPLGETFEAYDDFGRFRAQHHVTPDGRVLASALEIGRKRLEPRGEPRLSVDTRGRLEGSGDTDLDGDVEDAIDLVHRLAASDRVRQVFLRHVFRFWMGRNETLRDAQTLRAMDAAYVDSDGSLQEALVALLTSDSFLARK